MIHVKRAYEKASPRDGFRILVERLWPRGVSKARAALNLWVKEVAPSAGLRQWFSHDPAKWEQFVQRYWKELRNNSDAVDALRRQIRKRTVTFVYAARDEEHNGAQALRAFMSLRRSRSTSRRAR